MNEVITWEQILAAERESNRLRTEYEIARLLTQQLMDGYLEQRKVNENSPI